MIKQEIRFVGVLSWACPDWKRQLRRTEDSDRGYVVRLENDVTLILEIKGYEDDQNKAKHNAAKRWVSAVNNWGQLGRWEFHVCRNPQLLEKEIAYLIQKAA